MTSSGCSTASACEPLRSSGMRRSDSRTGRALPAKVTQLDCQPGARSAESCDRSADCRRPPVGSSGVGAGRKEQLFASLRPARSALGRAHMVPMCASGSRGGTPNAGTASGRPRESRRSASDRVVVAAGTGRWGKGSDHVARRSVDMWSRSPSHGSRLRRFRVESCSTGGGRCARDRCRRCFSRSRAE